MALQVAPPARSAQIRWTIWCGTVQGRPSFTPWAFKQVYRHGLRCAPDDPAIGGTLRTRFVKSSCSAARAAPWFGRPVPAQVQLRGLTEYELDSGESTL